MTQRPDVVRVSGTDHHSMLVPDAWPTLRVSALFSYPVKSCAGLALRDAVMTEAGLQHDRSFMVVSADGRCRTQRKHPRLALIQPQISTAGCRLVLRAPGSGSIDVDVDSVGRRQDVELFGALYRGIDQGHEVAGWLSDTLGVRSRLVRVPPEHDRAVGGHTPGTSGYADSCAVHILSEASLWDLNRRLAAGGSEPFPMERFRPNVVISGWDEPHVEDRLRLLRTGDAALGYAKLAIRCMVTMVDQTSGVKSGPEPIRTLAGYRRAAEGGVAFGGKFAVVETGKLAVGDEVTVDAWNGRSGLMRRG